MTNKAYTTPVYVSLPIKDVEVLDKLADKHNTSRTDLIRQAVSEFIERQEIKQ